MNKSIKQTVTIKLALCFALLIITLVTSYFYTVTHTEISKHITTDKELVKTVENDARNAVFSHTIVISIVFTILFAIILSIIFKLIKEITQIKSSVIKVQDEVDDGRINLINDFIEKEKHGEVLSCEVNEVFDSLIELTDIYQLPLDTLLNSMDELSHGKNISSITHNFKGDLATIKDNSENLRDIIVKFNDDLKTFSVQISHGDASYRIDNSFYVGFWKEILDDINSLVSLSLAPMFDIMNTMSSVSNGDLTHEIDSDKYNGDFNSFVKSINSTVEQFNSLILEVKSKIIVLNSASSNMDGIAEGMKFATDNVVDEVVKVTAEISNMNENSVVVASAVEEMSINTQGVSDNSQEVLEHIENVNKSIDTMSSSINDIAENSSFAASSSLEAEEAGKETIKYMNELNNSVTNIGKITDMIKKISEQTNLLALNATIEAASAGEAGKGFAVVANEIKELAGQSGKAAEEIETMINDVQQSTNLSNNQIKKIDSAVKETQTIVNIINDSVSSQQSEIKTIFGNTEETLARTKEVVTNINEIATATTEMSQSMGEMSSGLSSIEMSMNSVNSQVRGVGDVVGKIAVSTKEIKDSSSDFTHIVDGYTTVGEIENIDVNIFIPWVIEKFDVGVKEINDQHKTLVDIINKLYKSMRNGDSNDVMKSIINELGSYVEIHFRDEEALLEKHGYSGLQDQIEEHTTLIGQVTTFLTDLQTGKASISIELLEFLKSWLQDHILQEDMKYKEFFASKGVR